MRGKSSILRENGFTKSDFFHIMEICRCGSMVEHGLAKARTRVRFPSLAPVTFLFELLCLNLTYNQSVRVDFFVFTKELTRKGWC